MKNKEILKIFESKNNQLIIKTLAELKESGNKDLIPHLNKLLISTNSEDIKNEIIDIFYHLKDQNAVPFLVSTISDCNNNDIKDILISACWKNGLDYSDYYDTFIDIILENDFKLAFEALTVIENQNTKLNTEVIENHIDKLKSKIKNIDEQKATIISETINILERQKVE